MPSLTCLFAIVALAPLIHAHIEFVRLAHNGVWQPPLRYIRNRTSPWNESSTPTSSWERIWTFPVYPTDAATSIRCGRDSLTWAAKTETLKVKAGDEFEFQPVTVPPSLMNDSTVVQWDGCPNGKGACTPQAQPNSYYGFGIAHDGPASVFISRVPDTQDIRTYDGSGEWIKISTSGVEFRQGGIEVYWLPVRGARLIAKLPSQTPAGNYLLRIHQIWQGSNGGGAFAQIYTACAHIEVESNPSAGTLPKGIKIPEALCATCEGMQYPPISGLPWAEYMNGSFFPGGPIWDGEKLKEDKVFSVIKD